MDLNYGSIYCHICNDYIYDNEFESICRKQKKKSAKFLGISNFQYYPCWEPSTNELEVLRQNPRRKKVAENSFIGNDNFENSLFKRLKINFNHSRTLF